MAAGSANPAAGGRPARRRVAAAVCAAAALLASGCGAARSGTPAPACSASTWVAAWTADPSDARGPGLVKQTVRTILTANLGGDTLRVRLSNRLGSAPVSLEGASVGLREGLGGDLVPGTRRGLSFGGAATVTIPAGQEVASDPVGLAIEPFTDVAVSLFVSGSSGPADEHSVGQQTSFLAAAGSGDLTAQDGGVAFVAPTKARYFVSGLDVRATASVGVVVALGDSITDGFGGPSDQHDRYPDLLARRLAGRTGAPPMLSVVNAGISGNRVLSDARAQLAGPSALARLDSDVIGEPGVSDVIVLEGINDIGSQASGDQVIGGLRQIVGRLHAAGLRVQLGTLTPFESAPADAGPTPIPAEAARLAVNRWVRGPSGADGMIDFDAALRDPGHPGRLDPRYDSGDHLHPNGAGRRAMAGAVELSDLRGAVCRPG